MLEVRDLVVKIEDREILKNIGFSVYDGEIVGLVGESGSGKTMTSLAVAGLLSQNAKCFGDIVLDDIRLSDLSIKERRKYNGNKISFIFQEPMTSLNPLIKVGKQIEEVLKLHTNMDKEEKREKVLDIMKQVELKNPEKLYDMYPNELSGGMRQRVVIAMASVLKPSLIIADEPTTALDADTGKSILRLIAGLNKSYKSKVILISHDLNVVREICSRVIVMKDGEIVEEGSTKEIFSSPKKEYTRLLIEAVSDNEKKNKTEGGDNVLEVSDVSLYYKEKGKENIIADNINFNVKKGEILGILGRSGCGKSTLSRAIAGLSDMYHGSILRTVSENMGIQMVFQDPYSSLNPSKTIGFILSEPLKNKGGYTKQEIKEKVYKILKQIELSEEIYDRYPDELSGGQRQRVSIGIALISDPELIIADEPVSALDVTVQSQILELILKLQREKHISMIMISHDRVVLKKVCDRVIKWEEMIKGMF